MSLQHEFERQGTHAHPGKGRGIERQSDTSDQRLQRSRLFIQRHIDGEDLLTVTERLDKYLLLYDDIADTAGHLDVLIYPAGSADIYPILLADNVVIVDRAPLFNETKARSSVTRRAIARANRPVRMHEMATGTHGADVRDALKVTGMELHVQAVFALNQIIRMGYETFGKEADRGEDNFAHMMANLGILGVDLAEVRVRKLPGSYRISFPFEGTIKHIYYVQEEFSTDATREERVAKARAIVKQIGLKGRTGVMKKADLEHVAESFIDLEPDVIIMDTISSIPDGLRDTYDITELSDENRYDPLKRFGYKSQKEPRIDVQVAIRR